MANAPGIQVLSVCDDPSVRRTRELIFRKHGYEVLSVSSEDLLSLAQIRNFDVAVLCYTVNRQLSMAVVERLRSYKPDIRLLRVNSKISSVDSFYQADAEIIAGPESLLNAVKALAGKNAASISMQGPQEQGGDEYRSPFPGLEWMGGRAS